MVKKLVHFRLALANREAANGKAVKVKGADLLDGAGAQILEKAALGDAENKVWRRARRVGLKGALCPARCQGEAFFRVVVVGTIGDALIQDHHDVGIEGPFNFQHLFRGEEVL